MTNTAAETTANQLCFTEEDRQSQQFFPYLASVGALVGLCQSAYDQLIGDCFDCQVLHFDDVVFRQSVDDFVDRFIDFDPIIARQNRSRVLVNPLNLCYHRTS